MPDFIVSKAEGASEDRNVQAWCGDFSEVTRFGTTAVGDGCMQGLAELAIGTTC